MSYGSYKHLVPFGDVKHAAATSPEAVVILLRPTGENRKFICMGYVVDDYQPLTPPGAGSE